jgi:hypothetical protein
MAGGGNPAAPGRNRGLPENQIFFNFNGWNGIDTKPPRPGIDDDKCAWCDNIMPLGTKNARAMPDEGPVAYTAPGGLTIVYYDFYGLTSLVINNGPHAIIFLSDGSVQDYGVFTLNVTDVAPTGTFNLGATGIPGIRQYGTQYLLMSDEVSLNGYFAWDGANFYQPGSLSPEITILDDGRDYTSTPNIVALGGSGSGATFSSTITDGAIGNVTVTNPGSGWLSTDPTTVALLFSSGGGPTSAWGTVGASNGAITAIEIISGGSGFTGVPSIVITDGTGTGAQAVVASISGGIITAINVIDCGTGYTAPSISTTGGGGGGLNAQAVLSSGVLDSPTIVDTGGPYLTAPTVNFLSATGTGAQATAVIDSAGAVTGIDFGQGVGNGFSGTGYINPTYIYFSGGGVASATALLMPFGVQGHAIESYQGRAWVESSYQTVKTFGTAPGSAFDFSPADGGFVFPATSSVLKYQYSNLRQANGFLYTVGDSSVDYISGVNTTGTPPTTTFSNQNVDPQIGSPWLPSCEVFSRAVIIANPFGIHAIYGGAVQKISTPLDGVFLNNGQPPTNNPPTTAVAEIFGVHVLMVLMPILDPITGNPRNVLFVWDGRRWWTASQSTPLQKVRTNEWGSQITAWGLDSATQTTLFPLFQAASTNIAKTLRSKMWTQPGIFTQKRAMQHYALWQSTSGTTTLNFTTDTESASVPITQGAFTNSGDAIGWARSACPDNIGICQGWTMTSNSPDFTLIECTVLGQVWEFKI